MYTDRAALPEKPIPLSEFVRKYSDIEIAPDVPAYQDPETGLRMGAIHWIQKSGIVRRVIAHLIDLAILFGVIYGMITLGTYMVAAYPNLERFIGILVIAIMAVFTIVYFVLWEGLSGRSLGKLIFGIKVINDHGRRPGIWKTILRHILRVIDTPVTATIIFAVIVYDIRSGQRLGDTVAKTYVVRA
ncbi:RDD family protein [bacterium]|nr:RDD family protein [bacterium]